MWFNQLVKKSFKKLGYTILKGDLINEVKQMEALQLSEIHMPNCRAYPDRVSVLRDLPKNGIIAEVGVAYGDFSEILIRELTPKRFVAIDSFQIFSKAEEPWGKKDLARANLSHEEFYKNRFADRVDIEIKKGLSWDMLNDCEDNYFDFIYLDAGHRYPDVSRDIQALKPKLKAGGYVQFNDYTTIAPTWLEPFGVAKAVTELLHEGGYEMVAFCFQSGGYHDVVLKKLNS